MGAWGYKTFENDTATDWLLDFEDDGPRAIVAVINHAAAQAKTGGIDSIAGDKTLAAAEIVAAAGHGDHSRLSEDAISALYRYYETLFPQDLVKSLLPLVIAIRDKSELTELWGETKDFAAWQADITGLIGWLEDLASDL